MMEAGSGVEKNETSDLQLQLMQSCDVAITISFIDKRTQYSYGLENGSERI
jgi:hypothetical protein